MSDERAIEQGVELINAGITESLAILGAEILEINRANGWNVTTPEQFDDRFEAGDDYRLPAYLARVHYRLSEALEAYRGGDERAYRAAKRYAKNLIDDLCGDTCGSDAFGVPSDWPAPKNVKLPAILALVHSEVSEAYEAFASRDLKGFAEEMADVVIRVLDCTAGLGIDLGPAILAKLEKNRARGFRHGGKVV